MPILFSVVAREQNILANFASCDGNFIEISQQMLSKLPSTIDKMTYFHGPYLIHFILEDKHLYFCITDKTCQRSRAFLFLNQIHRRFAEEGKANFGKVLADEMYRYSEDYSTITIRKGDLDQLNSIGVESSETILGEKVLFVNKTEKLSYASVTYVGKAPEIISVSQEKSKAYVVIFTVVLLIFATSTAYIFGPVPCIIFLAVIAYFFLTNLKCQPDS